MKDSKIILIFFEFWGHFQLLLSDILKFNKFFPRNNKFFLKCILVNEKSTIFLKFIQGTAAHLKCSVWFKRPPLEPRIKSFRERWPSTCIHTYGSLLLNAAR